MRCAQMGLMALLLAICSGCGSTQVDVVDLNKVLSIFESTLTELDSTADKKEEAEIKEVKPTEENEEYKKKFLATYTENLNKAKLISSPIAAKMTEQGDVEGYKDANKNKVADTGEKKLFTVVVDAEGSRLIAFDDANHYRDQSYRPRGGFFTGYLIGSMLGRNRSYYSGSRAGTRTNYSKKQMSPKTYHKSAVSKARAKSRASSARSRSGSGGRSIGK